MQKHDVRVTTTGRQSLTRATTGQLSNVAGRAALKTATGVILGRPLDGALPHHTITGIQTIQQKNNAIFRIKFV